MNALAKQTSVVPSAFAASAATVLLLLVLGLSGCASSPVTNSLIEGDNTGIVGSVDDGTGSIAGVEQLDPLEHSHVCEALLAIKRMADFFRCHAILKKRVAADGGVLMLTLPIYGTREPDSNIPLTTVTLATMEARAYLEVGDNNQAIDSASRAMQVVRTKWLTSGNNEDLSKDKRDWFDKNISNQTGQNEATKRIQVLVPVLGVLSLAYARKGERNKAHAFMKQLESLETSGLETHQLDPKRRRWLAISHVELGEYEAAYSAMIASKDGAMKGFIGALELVNVLNPVYHGLIFGLTGRLYSFEDLSFSQEFEPRFMLHSVELRTGRLDSAAAGFQSILSEPRVSGYGNIHYGALHGKGQVARKKGRGGDAVRNFKSAVKIIEEQRSSINTERYKIGFIGDKQEVYYDLVETLADSKNAAEAFAYAERGKSRALIDMLAERRTLRSNNTDGRSEQLLAELDALERKSLKLVSASASDIRTRKADIEQKRQQLASASPEFASLVSVAAPKLKEIISRLRPDETLVEYFGHDEKLLVFVVTRAGVQVRKLNGKGLREAVQTFRGAIADKASARYAGRARRLYDRLIRPIASQLGSGPITIVPHGPLHYMPFAALHDSKGFLVEKRSIRVLPSASVLNFVNDNQAAGTGLLALGNPDLGDPREDLPGAQAETQAIKSSWPDARILLRQHASEATFKRFAPSARYLHLASHGSFDPKQPLASRLRLASGDGDDGNLTVGELYDLRLKAELVTLSACETGIGDVAGGDDVIGLTRGFLYAGARSIVASLWPVADSATEYLMRRFYFHLKSSGKAKSLRQAMLDTKSKYRHPYYWAAFQLTGEL